MPAAAAVPGGRKGALLALLRNWNLDVALGLSADTRGSLRAMAGFAYWTGNMEWREKKSYL